MIRAVTVFETASGKRYDSRKQALEAVADECREVLDKQLKNLHNTLGASALYKVVMELAPDAESIKALVDKLNAIIGEDEDDTDS